LYIGDQATKKRGFKKMTSKEPEDLAIWIESLIKSFIMESSENSLGNKEKEKAWAEPIIGFSQGDDPLYQKFKEDIGDFYWTPLDIFKKTFPRLKVSPGQLTVISWILPQTEATKADNRRQTVYPAERWARARIFGEEMNKKLHQHVVATLERSGFKAVNPMFSPFWELKTSKRYGFASTWSGRHAAYVAGLGTFGLSDGLITTKGKAMRCGSIVSLMRIPPTRRTYTNHHEFCLFYSNGTCGKCIQRCPVGAITEKGHDKVKCRNHLEISKSFVKDHYDFEGYGCGLCQTAVPCESGIPTIHE
jgi:epoxyqueuosine reductase